MSARRRLCDLRGMKLLMKDRKRAVYAFGKIRDTVKYRLKFAHFPYIAKALLTERSRVSGGLNILDVGCGPGNMAAFCGDLKGSKWFGVDLWEHQLSQASEKQVYKDLFQVNLVAGLPFRDNSFDVVICNEVLMYLPNAAEVLREFHRVVRSQGKVFVYNPISWIPKTMARLKALWRRVYQEGESVALDGQSNWKSARRPCRIKYYSFREFIREVEASNFQVVAVTGFRLFRNRIRAMTRLENYCWYFRMIRFLTFRYPFLAADVLVVGSKKGFSSGNVTELRQRAAA